MKVTTDIIGDDVLLRRLSLLERKVQGQILIKAARAGMKPILERARELAPRDTGDLAQRGIVARDTKRKRDYAERTIGHRLDHFYGMFQEFGVKPHALKTSKKMGSFTAGRTVMHPGHRAQPHLRPAADEKEDAAIQAARRVLLDAVMEAIRK